jgi:predicted lipoprotein with Yx(FWY)xxD motif
LSLRRSVTILIPLALALGACGSSSNTPTQPAGTGTVPSGSSSSVSLSTSPVAGLNSVLVSSQGLTLYTFAPDHAKKVTCTGSCAQVWPPAKIPAGQKAAASAGVKPSLVSSVPDPSGGRVVTYNGWPLYTYKGDHAAGTDNGQGLNVNGGAWYVIGPSGTPIRNKHLNKNKY